MASIKVNKSARKFESYKSVRILVGPLTFELEEDSTHRNAKTHAGAVSVPRDLLTPK